MASNESFRNKSELLKPYDLKHSESNKLNISETYGNIHSELNDSYSRFFGPPDTDHDARLEQRKKDEAILDCFILKWEDGLAAGVLECVSNDEKNGVKSNDGMTGAVLKGYIVKLMHDMKLNISKINYLKELDNLKQFVALDIKDRNQLVDSEQYVEMVREDNKRKW